ncbi:MAG: hypothetical protein A3E38_02490 [Candidatus Moranbacteria bacterium RIFCSPHIGHO2_12_FULL_54_9]|nr:MAG: hypothetical protein A3E38_02490 [Candidatus Moranbacteria bacterium RIFCSPHIGHO2_12_FULL_54_9]
MSKISVTIIPRAGKNAVEKIGETAYRAHVTAIPAENQANQKLIKLLAKYFSVAPSLIMIVSGATSRKKIIEIL